MVPSRSQSRMYRNGRVAIRLTLCMAPQKIRGTTAKVPGVLPAVPQPHWRLE